MLFNIRCLCGLTVSNWYGNHLENKDPDWIYEKPEGRHHTGTSMSILRPFFYKFLKWSHRDWCPDWVPSRWLARQLSEQSRRIRTERPPPARLLACYSSVAASAPLQKRVVLLSRKQQKSWISFRKGAAKNIYIWCKLELNSLLPWPV